MWSAVDWSEGSSLCHQKWIFFWLLHQLISTSVGGISVAIAGCIIAFYWFLYKHEGEDVLSGLYMVKVNITKSLRQFTGQNLKSRLNLFWHVLRIKSLWYSGFKGIYFNSKTLKISLVFQSVSLIKRGFSGGHLFNAEVSRYRTPAIKVGGAYTRSCMLEGGLETNNNWGRGWWTGSFGMLWWQFCVVMTTSCAIRTHSVTITTQGSCRVSAKQPTWSNHQKQANQSEEERWREGRATTLERVESQLPETGSGGHETAQQAMHTPHSKMRQTYTHTYIHSTTYSFINVS